MAFLTDSEKQQIRVAIAAAERGTRGELVTVIAARSDDYRYFPILWAALLALPVPALLSAFGGPLSVHAVHALQLGMFGGCTALFSWKPLRWRLVPGPVKRLRARRHAREQFLRQNLHHTSGHTGVLLFVSVAEHYVEILADRGIDAVVDSAEWEDMVQVFIRHLKQGRIAAGFLTTIAACGSLLQRHFPATGPGPNELPDHLVEV